MSSLPALVYVMSSLPALVYVRLLTWQQECTFHGRQQTSFNANFYHPVNVKVYRFIKTSNRGQCGYRIISSNCIKVSTPIGE